MMNGVVGIRMRWVVGAAVIALIAAAVAVVLLLPLGGSEDSARDVARVGDVVLTTEDVALHRSLARLTGAAPASGQYVPLRAAAGTAVVVALAQRAESAGVAPTSEQLDAEITRLSRRAKTDAAGLAARLGVDEPRLRAAVRTRLAAATWQARKPRIPSDRALARWWRVNRPPPERTIARVWFTTRAAAENAVSIPSAFNRVFGGTAPSPRPGRTRTSGRQETPDSFVTHAEPPALVRADEVGRTEWQRITAAPTGARLGPFRAPRSGREAWMVMRIDTPLTDPARASRAEIASRWLAANDPRRVDLLARNSPVRFARGYEQAGVARALSGQLLAVETLPAPLLP